MPHASPSNFIHKLTDPLLLLPTWLSRIPLLSILFEFTQIVYKGSSRLAGR